jgi:hypothetical protein
MKKPRKKSFTVLGITVLLMVIAQYPAFSPWWGFVIPVLIFGVVISLLGWQVPGFTIGFAAGFLLWAAASAFFSWQSHDILLERIARQFPAPVILVPAAAGVVGGLVTGLALYTGKSILTKKARPLPF